MIELIASVLACVSAADATDKAPATDAAAAVSDPRAAVVLDDPRAAGPLTTLIADARACPEGTRPERKGPKGPDSEAQRLTEPSARPALASSRSAGTIEEKWRAADEIHYEHFFKAHR
ncbi:MAG: hypothetical protein ACFB00_13365 [Parvularculaceae bacterium]